MNSTTRLTCFSLHDKLQKKCKKTQCKNWVNCDKYQNCGLIATSKGPLTLDEVGRVLSISRMSVSNLEMQAKKKIKLLTVI